MISIALIDRVAGVIEELRTNHSDVRQPCRSSDAHSRTVEETEITSFESWCREGESNPQGPEPGRF
jgi:hypothetical protein